METENSTIEVGLLNRLKNQTDSRTVPYFPRFIAWVPIDIEDLDERIWSNNNVDQSTNTKGAGCGVS